MWYITWFRRPIVTSAVVGTGFWYRHVAKRCRQTIDRASRVFVIGIPKVLFFSAITYNCIILHNNNIFMDRNICESEIHLYTTWMKILLPLNYLGLKYVLQLDIYCVVCSESSTHFTNLIKMTSRSANHISICSFDCSWDIVCCIWLYFE